MRSFGKFLDKTVLVMNEAAGWALAACVALVTVNVILRAVFGRPILGTYEWVGILTALSIGLSLSQCARVGGHITIDLLVDRFRPVTRKVFGIITDLLSSLFMTAVFAATFLYARKLAFSGEVTPTTKIPYYLFVFIIGFCFLFLAAVLVRSAVKAMGGDAE